MIDGTGTEGQVGRCDEARDGRGRRRRRGGERTRGRSSGLGRCGLAAGRGGRTTSSAADLRGIAGRGPEEGPQLAEADAPLPGQRAAERAPGDGAERRSENGRRGPADAAVVTWTNLLRPA